MLCYRNFVISLVFFLVSLAHSFATESKLAPEDILKHHLDSIGDAATRAALKTRVVEGKAVYKVLVSGSGSVEGKAVLVSDGDKLQLMLKINSPQYTGERFIRDGDKTDVARTYADKSRSEFGEFLRGEDVPLRTGLLGGVLTTGWPLLDLNRYKGKLHYEGLRKFDGVELIAVTYQAKKMGDMDVTLFFDTQTFRHVATVYAVTSHPGLGAGMSDNGNITASETASARQQQSRYRIEERFSDFKTEDGLTLPSHYDLRYQQELQSGFTKLVEWDVSTTRVLNNVSIDARNFQIH